MIDLQRYTVKDQGDFGAVLVHKDDGQLYKVAEANKYIEALQRENEGLRATLGNLAEAAEFIELSCDVTDVATVYPCSDNERLLREIKRTAAQMGKIISIRQGSSESDGGVDNG